MTTRCCTRRCSRTPATTCCSTWPSARTRSATGTRAFTGFSLDHTLWFHRPVRFDRWHLHTQETLALSGDRGLIRGAIHDADGHLVASVMQEVLVRPRAERPASFGVRQYRDSSMTSIADGLFQQPWPEGEYRLFQLGFVVDDLLGTAARWARVFGVGPFHVLPPIEQPCTYRGTASGVNVQVAIAQAGPVQIELIKQHCDRASVYRDLFEQGEAGFHQLCTVTPDYDAKKAHYEQLGYELVSEMLVPRAARRLLRHPRRLRLLHRGRGGGTRIPRQLGRDRADLRRVGRQ